MLQFSSKSVLLFLTLLCGLSTSTYAYKILAVLHVGSRSHHIVSSSLMKALAQKGHEVTVISPFPLKEPLENYHDIATPGVIKVLEDHMAGVMEALNRNMIYNYQKAHDMGLRVTETVFAEPGVQALIKSNQTFDAVVCEVFMAEALYGFSEHFKAPLIGLSTFGAISWNTDMVGSPSPPSYVPHGMLRFTERMTFTQRVSNLAFLTFERVFTEFSYLPRQEILYKQHFPNIERPLRSVIKNTALVLLNQHVSLGFSRPYVPNQIEVGGMHINRKRKPLPADIKKFLDEAKNGAIYFSMGSNLKSKNLPLEKRREILNTFNGLKQRVLWKFEDPNLDGKPDNVFISDWFPQDDILAHKNVLAFITHGGLLSTTESIYHGKPFVGIPFFGDQFLNMGRAEMNGYGIMLDYNTLTAATFTEAINRILNVPSYTKLVREMSARYRDQPQEPLDLAVYWVEHVVRHKGAEYLHCAGLDLNFIEYHNIDAMLILFGGLFMILSLVVLLIRLMWRCMRKPVSKVSKKQKKH